MLCQAVKTMDFGGGGTVLESRLWHSVILRSEVGGRGAMSGLACLRSCVSDRDPGPERVE